MKRKSLNTWWVYRLYLYGKIVRDDVTREEGKYFGYPKCCVEYYINYMNERGNLVGIKTVDGTCFAPCPACYEKGVIKVKNFVAVRNGDMWTIDE